MNELSVTIAQHTSYNTRNKSKMTLKFRNGINACLPTMEKVTENEKLFQKECTPEISLFSPLI